MTSPLDALEALEREATRGLRARALLAAPDAPRTCKGEVEHHTGVLVTCGKPLPCPDHPAPDAPRDEVK